MEKSAVDNEQKKNEQALGADHLRPDFIGREIHPSELGGSVFMRNDEMMHHQALQRLCKEQSATIRKLEEEVAYWQMQGKGPAEQVAPVLVDQNRMLWKELVERRNEVQELAWKLRESEAREVTDRQMFDRVLRELRDWHEVDAHSVTPEHLLHRIKNIELRFELAEQQWLRSASE